MFGSGECTGFDRLNIGGQRGLNIGLTGQEILRKAGGVIRHAQ